MSTSYKIKYKFLEEFNLLVEHHSGNVKLETVIESRVRLSELNKLNTESKFLIDLRESHFSNDIDKVKEFVVYLNDNFASLLKNQIVFITEEANQLAMATLFKMYQKDKARNIHVFSSLDYALLWLKVDVDIADMEIMIKEKMETLPSYS